MEFPWEMVPPLQNGIVGAVAFAAFCAVCLSPAYQLARPWNLETVFFLAEGTLKWGLLLVPK